MNTFFEELSTQRKQKDVIDSIKQMPSNYVGSKRRLLPKLWDVIENHTDCETVFDAFSGSSIVSLMLKHMGKKVITNDLLTSSAITAISVLENQSIPLTKEEVHFLCHNEPEEYGTLVLDNYKDKTFTEKECIFLDKYRRNVELLCGDKFYCGIDLLNKATLASIPNSNFSVAGDLNKLRSSHKIGRSFWDEKWRDTTRKRRDENNEIMFESSIKEMREKYKSAFALFAIENHVSQNCFLGGRMNNGQILANVKHRLDHDKSKGRQLHEIPFRTNEINNLLVDGECKVYNSDIIDLLKSNEIKADLIYMDPPYGGASSDYAVLYRFLEEFLYEDKLENLDHIQKGGKRFSKKGGYTEQFEELLSNCGDFPTWMLSYNDSSFANIDTITSCIKNAGRKNVEVFSYEDFGYKYRKGKSDIDIEHFKENYAAEGHKFKSRGIEYIILAK